MPEPRAARNRIRFEITVPGPDLEAELERLRTLGAVGDDALMTDPEGNEFCLQAASEPHGD